MTIKGTNKTTDDREFLVAAATELGLTGHAKNQEGIIELVAEGHSDSVWGLIKKITSDGFSVTFEEVAFQFADPKGEFKAFVLA